MSSDTTAVSSGLTARGRELTRRVLCFAAAGCLLSRPAVDVAVGYALLLAFALVPERRLSVRAERLGWTAVAIALLDRFHSLVPMGVALRGGLVVGALFVLIGSGVVFFAAARALTSRSRPGLRVRVVATLLATLATLEGGLRLSQRSDEDSVLSNAVPLVAVAQHPAFSPGPEPRPDLRGRVFSPVKAPGTFRVCLLGGSSLYGHFQTTRATSPPGVLEREIAKRLGGRPVEVLCFASPGLTSDQELGVIIGHALRWQVDLFLAIDGYNDLLFATSRNPDGYPGTMSFWTQHRANFHKGLLRALWVRSKLLRPVLALRVLVQTAPATVLLEGPPEDHAWLDGLAANETSMACLARSAGARFAWASVPLIYDRFVLGADIYTASRPKPQGDEVMRRMLELRALVPASVASQGGIVLDLASRFARRGPGATAEKWFGDECHYSDRGVEVLVEETMASLEEAALLPLRWKSSEQTTGNRKQKTGNTRSGCTA